MKYYLNLLNNNFILKKSLDAVTGNEDFRKLSSLFDVPFSILIRKPALLARNIRLFHHRDSTNPNVCAFVHRKWKVNESMYYTAVSFDSRF